MFKSAPLFGIGFNGFTDLYEITAHNSFVLCLAELGLLGSTLWVALLVTTTMGLNRIIGVQKKKQPIKFSGLLPAFETGYFHSAGCTTLKHLHSQAESFLEIRAHVRSAPCPGSVPNTTAAGIEFEPVYAPRVPQSWIVAMRLALVAFMTTSWFLSRSYTTTMYLILGLATATIALQRGDTKPADRGRWIFSSIAVEVMLIVVIYGLVRLRH